MWDENISRRRLLLAAYATLHGPAILAAQQHAHRTAAPGKPAVLEFLDAKTGAEIEALASEIIPSDGTPGAREAGVVYFIDRALATFDQDKRELYRSGMELFQTRRREMFPQSASLAALESGQRMELLRALEKTAFFEVLRMHTIMGFFANPSYGGNRDLTGWKLIGFEDKFEFQPPFGYYDAGNV